jgi:hypothetical protein
MNESSKSAERRQINIRLEIELHDFLVEYARKNYKTVTAVVREMIATLYRQGNKAETFDLSTPGRVYRAD